MSKKIVIVDYQIGNMFSVQRACAHIGVSSKISSSIADIDNSDALILPGVGAFCEAMQNIYQLNLFNPLQEYANSGRPIFGICLGLQLLFTRSDEFQGCNGLNLLGGEVRRIKEHPNAKIPHMGWSSLNQPEQVSWSQTPLENVREKSYFYFVHSYVAHPEQDKYILSTTKHGASSYCAAITKDNIFATQFHPEKSGKVGLKIYREWASINKLI